MGDFKAVPAGRPRGALPPDKETMDSHADAGCVFEKTERVRLWRRKDTEYQAVKSTVWQSPLCGRPHTGRPREEAHLPRQQRLGEPLGSDDEKDLRPQECDV